MNEETKTETILSNEEILEALEKVRYNSSLEVVKCFDILQQALHRLEAIDNSNHSEALECLEALEQDIKDRVILAEDRQLKLCAVIKQALLKAQEQENKLKALKLLMRELDCKDFAELRKYARCGYEKLKSKEIS